MIKPSELTKENLVKFLEEMSEATLDKLKANTKSLNAFSRSDLIYLANDDAGQIFKLISPAIPLLERLPCYSEAATTDAEDDDTEDEEDDTTEDGTKQDTPKKTTKSRKSKRKLSEEEQKARKEKAKAAKERKKERDELKNAKAQWKETERTSTPDVAKKLIIRYANLHKVKITPTTKKRAIKLLADLQRAIFNKQIRKQSPYADLIRKMQDNLLLIMEDENEGKIIEIDDFNKIKRLGIHAEVKNAHAGVVMRRFIKLAGTKLSREDAQMLITELKEQEDAHCDKAAEMLQEYIDGKRKYPVYAHELEGIYEDDYDEDDDY